MVAKKYDKLDKIFISVIILCVFVLIYFGTCALIFFRNKDVPLVVVNSKDYYNAIDKLHREYNDNAITSLSESQYKEIVEKELGLKFYIYLERDIKSNDYVGLTLPTIRTIIVDEYAKGYEYCITFAHETIHLIQFIKEERYVCFETFKYLYESNKLHDIGVWYAMKQLYGYYSGEYNISDLVIDYLTKN